MHVGCRARCRLVGDVRIKARVRARPAMPLAREALVSSWHIAAILVEAEHQNNTRKEQRLLSRQRKTNGRPLQLTPFSRQRLTSVLAALA